MSNQVPPGLPPAPPAIPAPSDRILIGGRNWRPSEVFWGKTGPGNAGKILGYLPEFDTQGRPKQDDVKKKVVDVWNVTALYALSAGVSLVYVGEGVLGDRLLRHYQVDEFADRWDTFTWVAPDLYEVDATGQAKLTAPASPVVLGLSAKQLVELFELLVIQPRQPNLWVSHAGSGRSPRLW
jgi:hypothetical protein